MQTHTVLPVITMFAVQFKNYTLQEPCEFSTNPQHNLATPGSDSANGASEPRTRKQDTHYAIKTHVDMFTNASDARNDLGTEHGLRSELLER